MQTEEKLIKAIFENDPTFANGKFVNLENFLSTMTPEQREQLNNDPSGISDDPGYQRLKMEYVDKLVSEHEGSFETKGAFDDFDDIVDNSFNYNPKNAARPKHIFEDESVIEIEKIQHKEEVTKPIRPAGISDDGLPEFDPSVNYTGNEDLETVVKNVDDYDIKETDIFPKKTTVVGNNLEPNICEIVEEDNYFAQDSEIKPFDVNSYEIGDDDIFPEKPVGSQIIPPVELTSDFDGSEYDITDDEIFSSEYVPSNKMLTFDSKDDSIASDYDISDAEIFSSEPNFTSHIPSVESKNDFNANGYDIPDEDIFPSKKFEGDVDTSGLNIEQLLNGVEETTDGFFNDEDIKPIITRYISKQFTSFLSKNKKTYGGIKGYKKLESAEIVPIVNTFIQHFSAADKITSTPSSLTEIMNSHSDHKEGTYLDLSGFLIEDSFYSKDAEESFVALLNSDYLEGELLQTFDTYLETQSMSLGKKIGYAAAVIGVVGLLGSYIFGGSDAKPVEKTSAKVSHKTSTPAPVYAPATTGNSDFRKEFEELKNRVDNNSKDVGNLQELVVDTVMPGVIRNNEQLTGDYSSGTAPIYNKP